MTSSCPDSPIIDVGVLGSINEDTIEHADGRIDHSLGGVLFTACALGRLGAGRLRVWLLAKAHRSMLIHLRQRLVDIPDLRLEGLLEIPQPGYRCHITYDQHGEKTEVLCGDVEPLTLDELAPVLPRLQALVVNFITGYEIRRETLAAVRTQLAGPVFMDLHSLTLGRSADGTRFPEPTVDIDKWLALADVVQMNESEARILGAHTHCQDSLARDAVSPLVKWATAHLDRGPRAIVVTRGVAGAIAAWRNEDGVLAHIVQPAHEVSSAAHLDPTGCGDVFLAAMAAAQIRGMGFPAAMAHASRAAAWNCHLKGIDELHRLPLE
jgi:sugar/nucleoside kinase (ribokinase family)